MMPSSRLPTGNEDARPHSPTRTQADSPSAVDEPGETGIDRDDDDEPAPRGAIDRVNRFTSGPQTSERLADILQCLIQVNAPDGGVEDCFHCLCSKDGTRGTARLGGNGYIWALLLPHSSWIIRVGLGMDEQETVMHMLKGVCPKSFGHLALQTEAPIEPELLEPLTVLWGAFYYL